MVGVASADGIPSSTDPRNAATVWIQDVYNGSGDDITSGVAVRWDCDASDNDMSMWVEQVDGAAHEATAGVVPYGRPLANGKTGGIIVKGPAIMFNNGNTVTAGTLIEADATGYAVQESAPGSDEAILGWSIKATATVANANLTSANYCIVFVDPCAYSND